MSNKQQSEHVKMFYRWVLVVIGVLLATHAAAMLIDYYSG